jgi:hypothetical protein
MRRFLPLLFLFAAQITATQGPKAQDQENTRLFRIYEDNDFLNIRGKGTDDAYTNGTRLDLFYTKNHPSRFVVDRKMPKAGDSSINVFGWGLMQVMFTPMDITKKTPQPNDYPWSGGLFTTHTLYSYNPKKKYSFQTELLLGMMGPAALAGQAQTFIHSVIHYKEPAGWGNQLGNNPLLNINFTAEKQLAAYRNWVEVIAGGQAFGGTALNGLRIYPMVRIGKMTPYFNGYLSQYGTAKQSGHPKHRGTRLQAYIVIKPEANFMLTNALLEGGIFPDNKQKVNGKNISTIPANGINTMVYSAYYGVVLAAGRWSMSFIQNSSTEWIKGTYSHEVGNISMYYSW